MHTLRRTLALAAFAAAPLALGALAFPSLAHAVCGDNVIDGDERCDGANVGGTTCAVLTSGFAQGGVVACKPDCTFDTTDCRRAFLESLIPANGGPKKNRCHLEFGTVGTTLGKGGQRTCGDGDPGCDQDHDFNSACTIRIQLCMDVPDPRMTACSPAKIIRLEVLKPSLTNPDTQLIASAVLNAAKGAAPDQARIDGNGVSYGPPITDFKCGSGTVKIPLRGEVGHARPGKVLIRARTSDNSGRIRSVGALKLTCLP